MNQETFLQKHSDFPSNSRLWVYPANRILTDQEKDLILSSLEAFTHQWAAHGTPLKASYSVLYNTFIVLLVDENIEPASGCSIDSSVKVIKELGTQLNINFLDRNTVTYLKEGLIEFTSLSDLTALNHEIVFDTSVASLTDFQTKFMLPFKESAFSKLNLDASFNLSLLR